MLGISIGAIVGECITVAISFEKNTNMHITTGVVAVEHIIITTR